MKKIYCDICKKEYKDDEFAEIDFATIEGSELRLFSDGDICPDCWHRLQTFVFSAIKASVYEGIKPIGSWCKQ